MNTTLNKFIQIISFGLSAVGGQGCRNQFGVRYDGRNWPAAKIR